MRVLLAHSYYREPGGEDRVFDTEARLLEAKGHEVVRFTVSNDQVVGINPVALAKATVWSSSSYHELRQLIRQERPNVAHFHNTLPLISPAGYYAAKAEGVPVVQTLHNYRLLCPNALFFRQGHPCEDCQGKFIPWPGVLHACYRGSRPASGTIAAMLTIHRGLRTWMDKVDAYIALTEFSRRKFIEGGLPAGKIVVKPNPVYPDPGLGEGRGEYALYVGRLSPEKGVSILLSAWEKLGGRLPLKVAGDGPLAGLVAEATRTLKGVEWLGRQSRERVLALMKEARVLIFPSVLYEGLPAAITESYAAGLPVIASNIGNMSTVVDHGRTGLHFRPNDPEDLAAQVKRVVSQPAGLAQMRREARAEFEAKYTAESNYQMLLNIYRSVAYGRYVSMTKNT